MEPKRSKRKHEEEIIKPSKKIKDIIAEYEDKKDAGDTLKLLELVDGVGSEFIVTKYRCIDTKFGQRKVFSIVYDTAEFEVWEIHDLSKLCKVETLDIGLANDSINIHMIVDRIVKNRVYLSITDVK